MKDPLLKEEEKKISKEELKKEKESQKQKKAIENLSYKKDVYLNANIFSKLFFFWIIPIIRVIYIIDNYLFLSKYLNLILNKFSLQIKLP